MKKLLTLALVASLAGITSAASIDWTISGINKAKTQINDAKGNALSGSVYLILASDASQLAEATPDTFLTTLNNIKLGEAPVSSGKVDGTTTRTASSNDFVSRLDGGSQYTLQVVVYDAANKSYYLSGTKSQYAYNPADVTSGDDVAKGVTFSKDDIGASSTYEASGYQQIGGVPEPATGALALAGIALLFKRRKA